MCPRGSLKHPFRKLGDFFFCEAEYFDKLTRLNETVSFLMALESCCEVNLWTLIFFSQRLTSNKRLMMDFFRCGAGVVFSALPEAKKSQSSRPILVLQEVSKYARILRSHHKDHRPRRILWFMSPWVLFPLNFIMT